MLSESSLVIIHKLLVLLSMLMDNFVNNLWPLSKLAIPADNLGEILEEVCLAVSPAYKGQVLHPEIFGAYKINAI